MFMVSNSTTYAFLNVILTVIVSADMPKKYILLPFDAILAIAIVADDGTIISHEIGFPYFSTSYPISNALYVVNGVTVELVSKVTLYSLTFKLLFCICHVWNDNSKQNKLFRVAFRVAYSYFLLNLLVKY